MSNVNCQTTSLVPSWVAISIAAASFAMIMLTLFISVKALKAPVNDVRVDSDAICALLVPEAGSEVVNDENTLNGAAEETKQAPTG